MTLEEIKSLMDELVLAVKDLEAAIENRYATPDEICAASESQVGAYTVLYDAILEYGCECEKKGYEDAVDNLNRAFSTDI